jgi:PAS domain S-box-containing protein
MFRTELTGTFSTLYRRHSFTLAFVLIGIVVIAVGAIVVNDLSNANKEVARTYTESIAGLDVIGELQYQSQEARRSMLYALTTGDADKQVEYADTSRVADERVAELLSQHKLLGHSPAESKATAQLDADWSAYLQIRYQVMALILEGNEKLAIEQDLGAGAPAFDKVRNDLQRMKQFHKTKAETQLIEARASYSRSLLKLMVILALTQLVSVIAVRLVQRNAMLGTVQRSESRMREVIESINEGMCVIGADQQIELWNHAAETSWQKSRGEVLGKNLFDAFPGLTGTPLPGAIAASNSSGEGGTPFELSLDVRAEDGISEIFEVRVFPFEGGVTIFFNDVTARKRAEQARRETEQRYRNLFENASVGVYRTTPDGHVLLANPTLIKMLGFESFEQLAAQDLESGESLSNYQRQRFKEMMERFGEVRGLEAQFKRRDGSSISIRENSRAIKDADGRIAYYEGTIEDITERKQAEDQLRESQALFDSLVNSLPQNVFCKGLDGRFTFANRQFCETLGMTLEDIVDKSDRDFFPLHLAEKYEADDRRAATGQVLDMVEENVGADGLNRYVRVVKTPRYDARGHIAGVQGIFWDVTEEKRAQDLLAREKDLLHSLMDNIPEIIYFKDTEGRFVRVNRAKAQYVGLSDPEQAVGKTDFDFYPEDYARDSRLYDNQIIKFGQPIVGRVERVTSPDGIIHWMLSTRAPIKDKSGRVISIVGIARDITERKQAEDALEQSMADLLGVVSSVSLGDLTRRGIEGDDTIGRIARSLNRMLDNFSSILTQVMGIAMSVSSNAIEVLSASEQISIGSDRQVGEITSTSSAVEEMAASMNQVSKNAETSVESARRALMTAIQGDTSVRNTSEAMMRINTAVLQTADKMRVLAKRGSEITEIINLINGIASQTNLLAVNAAIQAAHAGEAGLGFSVVAEEIRKLAEGSARATKDISRLVTAIQRETAEALTAMQQGMNEVNEGASLAEQARQSLQKISSVVKQSAELIEEISAASEEQARTTRNVAGAMQTISSIALETSAGAQETTRTISGMVSLSDKLNNAISQFKVKDEFRSSLGG